MSEVFEVSSGRANADFKMKVFVDREAGGAHHADGLAAGNGLPGLYGGRAGPCGHRADIERGGVVPFGGDGRSGQVRGATWVVRWGGFWQLQGVHPVCGKGVQRGLDDDGVTIRVKVPAGW